MKKVFFIIAVSILVSCIKKVPPKLPVLEVTPDTNVTISSINPVTFKIDGYGSEELKKIQIETSPFFYKLDTSFQPLTHSYKHDVTVDIPELLPTLPQDSIATITFTLFDSFNKVKKVVKMKVVTGYLKVFQDTATLVFNSTGTMFYNTKLGLELDFYYANDLNIDLVLLYDNQLGFVLASPDAPFARQKFQDIGLNYFINEKNHTQITRFSTPMEFITEKFLFYMGLTDSYIADNETFGVGEEQLNVGDILAFKCADERKGVLKVIDINTVNQSLTFFMKVQRN